MVDVSSSHWTYSLDYWGFGDPDRAIVGRHLKIYEEVDVEAAGMDGGAAVSSVSSVVNQDLVELLGDLDLPVRWSVRNKIHSSRLLTMAHLPGLTTMAMQTHLRTRNTIGCWMRQTGSTVS